jgi:uncharacterized membrane protein YedE/YeeE
MMGGLVIGAFVATHYLIRENARLILLGETPFMSACEAPPKPVPGSARYRLQPVAGTLVAFALLAAGVLYLQAGHGRLAVFLYFGIAFGVVFQRSRFCLVNAFREPFMTGQSEHARGAALALVLSMIGFAVLKATDLRDAADWVFPSFWLGALLGGVLFGIGMVLAGGCGAGSIWRAGEGHVKLWLAVFCFAIGASTMRLLLVRTDLIRSLGRAVFLPDLLGWAGALWGVAGLMVFWYFASAWNEQRKQAGVLKF